MMIYRKWLAGSLVLLALIQVAYGIQVTTSGGGAASGSGFVATQIDASKDASVQGTVSITGADIKPFTVISGPITTFSQTHQVKDKSGKAAKVTVSVVNAPDGLDYASEVKPAEGILTTIETQVSAEQWLTVPKADSIKCSAIATYKTLSADASIAEVKGSAKGDNVTLIEYGCKATATATDAIARQNATSGSGGSIKILNHAKNGTVALSIETPITGFSGKRAEFEDLDATSSAGTLNQVTQNVHAVGKFTSTAKSGTKTTSRTSDFGTTYDLIMTVAKGCLPTGKLGYYITPSMATTTTGAIKGALSKARDGDTINAASGTYNEDVNINKAITLIGSGSPTANSFTLNSVLGSGSGGITAPIVNVTSSARVQDGIALTSSGGTLNVAAGKYNEDVVIDKGLAIVGSGNPTVNSFWLSSGAFLGAGSGSITAPDVFVVPGSRINDGMKLISDGGTLHVATGYFDEDVIISKALSLIGSIGPTARSFTLNTALGSGSGGITASTVNVNSGGKIQDGVNLSSQTVNVGPGYFKENVLVNKDLSIKGSGKSFTGVDGSQAGPVFHIDPGKTVTLSDMTIRNGNAYYGGGIRNYGNLAVNDCTISGNSAAAGGGIYNDLDALTVTGSTISSNFATYDGGGIYSRGTSTVSGSTISGNSVYRDGGGIYSRGTSTVSGSTISGNSANDGGGICSWDTATATVTGSTISSNSANNGGGIYSRGPMTIRGGSTFYGNTAQDGGGIFSEASLTIKEGTNIYGNNATIDGGGIYKGYGRPTPIISADTKIYGNTPNDKNF